MRRLACEPRPNFRDILDSEGMLWASETVDGHDVPVPHFGIVLAPADWQALADRLRAAGTVFGIAPHTRFAGQPGEQSTMFFRDPSGNALEFKAFADDSMIFETGKEAA